MGVENENTGKQIQLNSPCRSTQRVFAAAEALFFDLYGREVHLVGQLKEFSQ